MDKSKLLVAASLAVIISMVLCLVPMEESDAVDVSDYAGLTAAISSSDGPTTITLIDDIESNSQISIVPGKDIVLDLNGNNITFTSTIGFVCGGELTIKDSKASVLTVSDDYKTVEYNSGTISVMASPGTPITVAAMDDGVVTIESGHIANGNGIALFAQGDRTGEYQDHPSIVVNGGYVTSIGFCASPQGSGASVTVNGGVMVSSDNATVAGNGTIEDETDNGGTIITINGGTLISHIETDGYIACGIYAPNYGTVSVNGGTVYADGGAGVVSRAGTVIIGGGDIIATGTTDGKVCDGSTDVPSAAVVVDQQVSYPGAEKDRFAVTILGGSFSSEESDTVSELKTTEDKTVTRVIGGDFDSIPVSLVPSGYEVQGDSIVVNNPVAKVGESEFASLQDAIDGISTDGTETTITLIDNVTLSDSADIAQGKNIILDMGGYTIAGDSDFAERFIVNRGILTITGDGVFDASDDSGNVWGPLNNFGTLTIKNGTFKGNLASNASLIWNRSGGTATFDGGNYSGSCTAIATEENSTTYINGGIYYSPWYPAIDNSGDMTITAGEFTNTSCSSCDGEHWGYCIRNGELSNTAHLIIKPAQDEDIIVTGTQGALAPGAGITEVYGGIFKTVDCDQKHGAAFYALYVAGETGETKTTVYGGSFTSFNKSAIYVGNSADGGIEAEAILDIFGGSFGVSNNNAVAVLTVDEETESAPSAAIYGGHFDREPNSHYIPVEYAYDSTTGRIILNPSTGAEVVAVIGDAQFSSLNEALESAVSGSTIILQANTDESITIVEGLSITLNLNGYTITNSEGQNTITVEGELTIVDDTGNGTIDNTSNGKSAIYNNGTVTIKSGNITKSVNVAGNTYYVVFNHGTMSIEGGHIYSDGTAASSLIVNGYSQPATMTISGGHIEFWFNAVKNEEYGTLTVTGGTIDSDHQSIQNWNVATITGGTFNGEVATWHYNANHGSHTMTIEGGTFNDDVYTAKYVDDLETGDIGAITADPQITIKGGVFNGRFLTIKGDLTNSEILTPAEDEKYDWMDVSGGTFTNPVADRFLAPGFALTGNDGMYGVGQGHRIAFDVSIDGYDVEVTSADGTIEYGPEADGSYLLADGSYRAIFTASGYGATSINFEVDGSDSTIPVKMSAVYGITITATPSEAEITIDGKSVENGIEVQLTEGTHKVTVSLDGYVTETFEITVGENGQTAYTVALDPVDDGPDYPPIIPGGDDDDVVIPPIYVPSDTSSSDDDTVKIVACAAAAVVAAIMAAFLILGHRRD